VRLAEIRLSHRRVGLHFGRRARGNAQARVEHHHVVGDSHHHRHVVFHEHDCDPGISDTPKERG
jgi:hypothetical protein